MIILYDYQLIKEWDILNSADYQLFGKYKL